MATPNPNLVPTLGILELSSIAKGLQVADLMLKKAEVRLLKAGPVGSGKFMIHLTGDEADLLEAVEEGHLHSDPFLVSWTYIPNLHPQVLAALQKEKGTELTTDAVGIVEGQALAALVQAADRAVKTTAVRLLELTYNLDLGGKGYFTFTGDLSEVEAALASAEELLREEAAFVNSEILARPHDIIQGLVLEGLESSCF